MFFRPVPKFALQVFYPVFARRSGYVPSLQRGRRPRQRLNRYDGDTPAG